MIKQKLIWCFTFVKRDSLEVTPPVICLGYTLAHATKKVRLLFPANLFDIKASMKIDNPNLVIVPRYCTIDLESLLNKQS